MRQGKRLAETDNPQDVEQRKQQAVERRRQRQPTKLSYKHQRELDQLPAEIEELEVSIAELQKTVSAAGFYAQDNDRVPLYAQSGTLKHGTNIEIGYFDQLRQTLDLEKSVAYNVGEGRTYISMNGKDRHVVGYLKGFLFSPKRSMTPVRALSGGERNRVILAKLFTRPANLLVLDEPTNDLDIETLEVLEERLCAYNGTLIVVSHDREFLDNVVTSTIVFEDDGSIQEYVGGYRDWLRQGKRLAETDNPQDVEQRKQQAAERRRQRQRTKLSYKHQRELDQLPAEIEELEVSIAELQKTVSAAGFYAQDNDRVQQILRELADAEDLRLSRLVATGQKTRRNRQSAGRRATQTTGCRAQAAAAADQAQLQASARTRSASG